MSRRDRRLVRPRSATTGADQMRPSGSGATAPRWCRRSGRVLSQLSLTSLLRSRDSGGGSVGGPLLRIAGAEVRDVVGDGALGVPLWLVAGVVVEPGDVEVAGRCARTGFELDIEPRHN